MLTLVWYLKNKYQDESVSWTDPHDPALFKEPQIPCLKISLGLSLWVSCKQRGGPASITAVTITRPHVTCWLCQVPCDWPRAYSVPSWLRSHTQGHSLQYCLKRRENKIYFTHESFYNHFCEIFLVKMRQLLSTTAQLLRQVYYYWPKTPHAPLMHGSGTNSPLWFPHLCLFVFFLVFSLYAWS